MKVSLIYQLLLKLQQFLTRSQRQQNDSNKSVCAAQQWSYKARLNQFRRRVRDAYFRLTTSLVSGQSPSDRLFASATTSLSLVPPCSKMSEIVLYRTNTQPRLVTRLHSEAPDTYIILLQVSSRRSPTRRRLVRRPPPHRVSLV